MFYNFLSLLKHKKKRRYAFTSSQIQHALASSKFYSQNGAGASNTPAITNATEKQLRNNHMRLVTQEKD